jgi:hypothetical protein
MIRDLLTEGAETGDLRDDVAPDELASYCLHALAAAGSLPSKARSAGSSWSFWLGCTPAQPVPRKLRRLKAVRDRGQMELVDMVTEAALRTGMLGGLTTVSARDQPSPRRSPTTRTSEPEGFRNTNSR